MKKRLFLMFLLLTLIQVKVFAALQLELTQGMSGSIPIAVVPLSGQEFNPNDPNNVTAVIQADLKNSGQFNVLNTAQINEAPNDLQSTDFNFWRKMNVNNVVIGHVIPIGNNYFKVKFSLLDVPQGLQHEKSPAINPVLISKEFSVSKNQLRAISHHISDIIFETLTGNRGIFSTKIAYILVEQDNNQKQRYKLAVADADGYNPRYILNSNEPIMSPTWSPNGKKIAYVSFEKERSAIYIQDLASGRRELISNFPGLNQAPSWSPDGNKLVLVLSKTGYPKVYSLDLRTRQLTQLTSDMSIDTEPSFAPDGKSVIFTSDRGGGPQIYRLNLADKKIDRVTFDGNYNATASFTPNGEELILLHLNGDKYTIALQDLASGGLTELTQSGNESSPSVSPNGEMVIFASDEDSRGVLGIVSTDGRIRLRLPSPEGSVREPAWSPFLG